MKNRLALLALPALACLLALPSDGFAQRIGIGGIGLGGGGGGWGGRGFGGPGISIGNVGIGLGGGGYGRGGWGGGGWGGGYGPGWGGYGNNWGYGRSGININLGSGYGSGYGRGYGYGSNYYGSNYYSSGYYAPSYSSGANFYATPSYGFSQPYYSAAPSATYVEGFAGGPVVQSGALNTQQSFYPPTGGEFQQQQAGDRAMIHVHVPSPSAQVLFDGTSTNQGGMDRVFSSPPLNPGQSYTYEISARWTEGGQERQMSRKVSFEAGRTVHVDFTQQGGGQQQPQPAGAIEGGIGGPPQRQPLNSQPQDFQNQPNRDLQTPPAQPNRDLQTPPAQPNRDLQTPPAVPSRTNPDQGGQDRQQTTPQTRPQQSQDLLPRD